MKTKEDYLEKLRSMRDNVYIDGEMVKRDDPRLIPALNVCGLTYEMAGDPQYNGIMTATSQISGKKINRFTHVHKSVDDLLKKQEMTRLYCQKTFGCIARCMGIDATNALSVVTHEMDQSLGTKYYNRFSDYLNYFQEKDIFGCCAQSDVKGDRSKRPHQQMDPDLYVRIVEKKKEGVVVRGAKAHNSWAPCSEEIIVIPTRMLTKEESEWAIAFAIPGDHPDVHLVVRPSSPRQRKYLDAPIARYGVADSQTIFDDALIPWDRVFMCGEWEYGGRLALLFALYHRHSYTGCKPATTDVLMGASALVAEYNGIEKAPHVRDKLADMIAVSELVYGAGIASSVKGKPSSSGTYIPDVVYANVARYHAGVNIYHEHEILVDLAGGLPATLPPEGDFLNDHIGPLLNKYIMRNPEIPPEHQNRCFRMISDLNCSGIGGVMQYAGIHGGGSPIMEKIALMGQYDIQSKKNIAKELAGIPFEKDG